MSIDESQMMANSAEDTEDFATLLAEHGGIADTPRPQAGQKVSGTVIEITGDNVFVNIGVKVDGIMDRADILDLDGKETVKAGDTIEAWITKTSPQEIRLSRSMSGSGMAALEEAQASAIPVDGKVTGICKGGYTVEVLGKSAFCPGSQMENFGDPEQAVGRTMQFLILRVESRGRNVIVSHRALKEREREENLTKVLETLKAGDIIEGRITRLAPFGAFMELAPGVEGMIHLSELSWSRVGQADEAVSHGDRVRVKVLAITQTDKGVRISLSRKQADGDPWEEIGGKLQLGQVVQGKVVRIAPFGAFVEILPGIEGLVHVSEMSWTKRIARPEDVVTVGETVSVKIQDINTDSRRISLSLRDAEGDPWADITEKFSVGQTLQGTVESSTQYGIFVTLADGITGLLPAGTIKRAKNVAEFTKIHGGESISVVIQNIDVAARRISLVPEGSDVASDGGDSEWKVHMNAGRTSTGGMGIMAQALQKALQKN